MLILAALWLLFMFVSFEYFHNLFDDLGCVWGSQNRVACFLLSVAGPAAMVLALCVDGTRPLHSIV